MALKGKLKSFFEKGDLDSVIEYCWENEINTHEVLQSFRDRHGLTVSDTDRARNRLSRRKQYRTGKAQEYVKKRYGMFDFSVKPGKTNANGTRKWEKHDYIDFLKIQDQGKTEVEIARTLKTNLVIVKYLRTKRKLAMHIIDAKRLKPTRAQIATLMVFGENTLKKVISGDSLRYPII